MWSEVLSGRGESTPNYQIICKCVRVHRTLATIQGQCLFQLELPIVWLLFDHAMYLRMCMCILPDVGGP